MEYVYSAMLLHSAKQPIDEAHVKKVLEAAGVKADDGKVKALVASLQDVDIEEAMSKAAMPAAAPAQAPASSGSEEKKEEKKEEDSEEAAAKAEENASAGLGSLFG